MWLFAKIFGIMTGFLLDIIGLICLISGIVELIKYLILKNKQNLDNTENSNAEKILTGLTNRKNSYGLIALGFFILSVIVILIYSMLL